MKKLIRHGVIVLGGGIVSIVYLNFMWLFFSAVAAGGSVTMDLNHFGEMWIEVVIMLFFLPFAIMFMFKVFFNSDKINW